MKNRWGLLALLAVLAGCRPQLHLHLGGTSPERAAWEAAVSERINQHEDRLEALEQKGE